MKITRGRVMPVLISAVVLVGGANVAAYAATGRPLLLGRSNTESRTAGVTNTGSGAALSLRTRSSAPPLKVSSGKLVKHLNADMVDGMHASSLPANTIVLTDSDTSTMHASLTTWSLAAVPTGNYLVSWDVNLVPGASGSYVCGVTTTDFTRQFAADQKDTNASWIAVWLSGSTVMSFNRSADDFFCQAVGVTDIQLKNPLTISFTKVAETGRGLTAAASPARAGARR